MAANTTPIFLKQPSVQYISSGTTANTLFDGTQTTVTVFTADATNGSKIEDVYLENMGTNVATVVRFFINNGSTAATATNNALVNEITWATYTASQVAATGPVIWRANLVLKPGYKLNASIGTAVASGIMITAVGGDY